MFVLNLKLLHRVHIFDRNHVNSTDEVRKAEADRRIGDFYEVKRQWKDIDSNKSQFGQSYMQDTRFVPVWEVGLQIVREVLRNKNSPGNSTQKQSDFMRILTDYESLACSLRDQMVDTAHQGLLKKEVLYSIQDRWIRLDEILDWYYDLRNRDLNEDTPSMSRLSPKW